MRIPSIAIIGAGPIGLSAANALTSIGFEVTLFEAGADFSECPHLSRDSYIFQTESKIPKNVHRVGGGSNYWHRRIGEFLPLDFKNTQMKCQSEWDITIQDLQPYYLRAMHELGEDKRSDEEVLNSKFRQLSKLLPGNLEFRLIRYSKSKYFVNLLSQLKKRQNFRLITSTKCIEIEDVGSKDDFPFGYNLRLQRNEEFFNFSAEIVLVACGAMNSPVLVYNSPSICKSLNKSMIGAGLMEHFDGTVGKLHWKRGIHAPLLPKLRLNSQRKLRGKNEGLGLKISESLREANRDVNLHIEIINIPLSRRVVNRKSSKKVSWPVFSFVDKLSKFPNRVISTVVGNILGIRTYSVWVKAEELPNDNSTISVTLDESGVQRAVYNHQVSDESKKQFLKALISLQSELHENAVADFVIDDQVMNGESSLYKAINWHPMGTLRMGLSPSNSVCDSNLKIFGTQGVYVVDASVFPRGSNGNPTFTAIALSLRLAQKLKSDFYKND